MDENGTFVTSLANESMVYFNWDAGEPDATDDNNCVLLSGSSYKWEDASCDDIMGSICEFEG